MLIFESPPHCHCCEDYSRTCAKRLTPPPSRNPNSSVDGTRRTLRPRPTRPEITTLYVSFRSLPTLVRISSHALCPYYSTPLRKIRMLVCGPTVGAGWTFLSETGSLTSRGHRHGYRHCQSLRPQAHPLKRQLLCLPAARCRRRAGDKRCIRTTVGEREGKEREIMPIRYFFCSTMW